MKGMTAEVERTDWLSYPTENFIERITELNHRQGLSGVPVKPPGVYPEELKGCFYLRIEVLSRQGKGMLKEAFQVDKLFRNI